jgi:hypothetical protein
MQKSKVQQSHNSSPQHCSHPLDPPPTPSPAGGEGSPYSVVGGLAPRATERSLLPHRPPPTSASRTSPPQPPRAPSCRDGPEVKLPSRRA